MFNLFENVRVLKYLKRSTAIITALLLTIGTSLGILAHVEQKDLELNISFVALEEAAPEFTLTFHLYTPHQYIWDTFADYTTDIVNDRPVVVVHVTPGTPQATWQGIEDALRIGNIYGLPNRPGYAFWGWFRGETLDVSGRTDHTTGLRRPAIGDGATSTDWCEVYEWQSGFGIRLLQQIENATTDAVVIDLFGSTKGGNIDLFGIWSLWGDVLDEGAVTTIGLERLRTYLAYSFGLPVCLNRRAADVWVDGAMEINTLSLELIRQYLAYGSFGVPIVLGTPRNP